MSLDPRPDAPGHDALRHDAPRGGALLLVGAAFWFSVMSLLVKVGGRSLPAQELVLARSLVTLALSYAAVRFAGISPWGHARALLTLRGLLGFGALSLYFIAVTRLPLAEVTVIHFLNPILAALLAAAFLRERLRPGHAAGVALSLAGVLLVTRPGAIFGSGAPLALDPWGVAAALAGAVLAAAAYVTVRHLNRTEEPLVIVFYFSIVAVPAAVPLVLPVFVWPHGLDWLVMLGVGVATQIAQVLLTRGLALLPAGPGTAVGYVQILFAAAWGLLLFGERPSGWTLGGALLVVFGVIAVVLDARR